MLAIELAFPTGRYHATPWDQHTNEGVVEWPPSPWRILRALVATWYLKAREDVAEETAAVVVEALAAELPRYALVQATPTHTRHYMPTGEVDAKGKPLTSKTFDPFLHLGAGARIGVIWSSVSLDRAGEQALALLLTRVGYLGRAESLVEARLAETVPDTNCFAPGEDDPVDEDACELTRVLAPVPPSEFGAWCEKALTRQLGIALSEKQAKAMAKGKPATARLSAKERGAIEDMIPASLFQALQAETNELRQQGWTRPPGTRWVTYARPRLLVSTAPTARPRLRIGELPKVARFAVNGAVPRRLTEALYVAERTRKALMSKSNAAPVFSGRGADSQPNRRHEHAFILPEANGRTGDITHVTVYARMGFDEVARRALDTVRQIWGGAALLDVVLLGVGDVQDFAGTDVRAGQCPLVATSTTWISRTPFVPTRHPKQRGDSFRRDETGLVIGSPEHDLVRLLHLGGCPPLARPPVPVDHTLLGGQPTRWSAFRTRRIEGDGRRGPAGGFGFRIEFVEAVQGPIALGYGAHFGLGVFVPDDSETR
jgi:CRISPR-associated protein Csb2